MADPIKENSCQDFASHREEYSLPVVVTLLGVNTFLSDRNDYAPTPVSRDENGTQKSSPSKKFRKHPVWIPPDGMEMGYRSEHEWNHRRVAAPPVLSISAQMPHHSGAFPPFSWLTARLLSSRVGGSELTRDPHPGQRQHPRETHDREVYTIQLLKLASPSGPDLRISRQCRSISYL